MLSLEGHRIIAFMEVYGKRPHAAVALPESLVHGRPDAFDVKNRLSALPMPFIIRSPVRRDHLERWQSG